MRAICFSREQIVFEANLSALWSFLGPFFFAFRPYVIIAYSYYGNLSMQYSEKQLAEQNEFFH